MKKSKLFFSLDDSAHLNEDSFSNMIYLRTVAVGESSLDRIACALNGKIIVPIFLQIANQLLQDCKIYSDITLQTIVVWIVLCCLACDSFYYLQLIGRNATLVLWVSPLLEKDVRELWSPLLWILSRTSLPSSTIPYVTSFLPINVINLKKIFLASSSPLCSLQCSGTNVL